MFRIWLSLLALALPVLAQADRSQDSPASPGTTELAAGRGVLLANDGWGSVVTAALPRGTTGGADAEPARTVVVSSRNELVAALAFPDAASKLIFVRGLIDANVDDAGKPLTCGDYYRPDPATGVLYSLPAFLAAYDPFGPWGRVNPNGPQERARASSAAAQQARVRIQIPPNTTIYGMGPEATVRGAWFDVRPVATSGNQPMNVVIRNLSFEDAADCFPTWDPNDGATGNWNSNYDSISVRNATHVWIDHNRFADARTFDASQPVRFGRLYQVHDGHVDITNESDYVTVSWNQFLLHDKTMLIGGSDSAMADRGKLRVTLHHNLFEGVGQRAPRVRFGQVHAYNNLYRVQGDSNYVYSWGIGVESQLVAEHNYVELTPPFSAADVIERFNGSRVTSAGNCLAQKDTCVVTDFVGERNERFDPDLVPDAGWTPARYGANSGAGPVGAVRASVLAGSGPRK